MTDDTDRERRRDRFRRAERGVSFTVSYALTVAIATLLITGVIATAGYVLDAERERAIQEQSQVVADDVAASLVATDRLVHSGNESNVTVVRRLPRKVVDQPYVVELRGSADETVLTVRTESPSVTASVPLRNRTEVANASVTGGPVRIVYNRSGAGALTLAEGST